MYLYKYIYIYTIHSSVYIYNCMYVQKNVHTKLTNAMHRGRKGRKRKKAKTTTMQNLTLRYVVTNDGWLMEGKAWTIMNHDSWEGALTERERESEGHITSHHITRERKGEVHRARGDCSSGPLRWFPISSPTRPTNKEMAPFSRWWEIVGPTLLWLPAIQSSQLWSKSHTSAAHFLSPNTISRCKLVINSLILSFFCLVDQQFTLLICLSRK